MTCRISSYHENLQAQGLISGPFLIQYSIFRLIVKFVQLPDPQLGFIGFGWFTMGQLPKSAAGMLLVITAHRCRQKIVAPC